MFRLGTRLRRWMDMGTIRSDRAGVGVRNGSDVAIYSAGFFVLLFGLTYSSAPLYKIICQATGLGGLPTIDRHLTLDQSKLITKPRGKRMRITLTSNVGSNMPWTFKPAQRYLSVRPGEPALAFFTVSNDSESEMTGIATYNVVPNSAAPYLNKIQCFCFEEQKLSAGESVEMPVYFYIDPDISDDILLDGVQDLVLSYTFFPTAKFD